MIMGEALRLGVAGLGTVGAAVVRMVEARGADLAERCGRAVVVTGVSARDRARDRGFPLDPYTYHDDPIALAQSPDIDVFVEMIGGANGAALEAVYAAIAAGKSVITANKAMIAANGQTIAERAEAAGVAFLYEAAVAGGIPVIKALRESMAGNQISRVYGILNGTCNYILTRMEEEGRPFEDILKDAQDLGYAEADPTFDVGGHDTAHKLVIMASLAFGTQIAPDNIYLEGIEKITPDDIRAASELGYRIKLLGVAQKTASGIEQRIHPTMVPRSAPIARVSGVTNAVAIDSDALGQTMLIGPGAGGDATASSVISDICDLARGLKVPTFGRPVSALVPYQEARMRAHEGGYYIRFSVFDRPGAFSHIASQMAENSISLRSIVQNRGLGDQDAGNPDAPMPVVLITHTVSEAAIRSAVESIESGGYIVGSAQVIRIESL